MSHMTEDTLNIYMISVSKYTVFIKYFNKELSTVTNTWLLERLHTNFE